MHTLPFSTDAYHAKTALLRRWRTSSMLTALLPGQPRPSTRLMRSRRNERAIAAYLGLAIGDALGSTVEFLTPREIQQQFKQQGGVHRDIIGGGWLRLKAGQVTVDTTMSLALGTSILNSKGVDALAAAQAFDGWMRAKPVDIGNTVRRNLIQFRRSGQPEAPESEHDAGNGAAMRVLPVALASLGLHADEIRRASRAQAHVTHHNAVSDAACETLIFMLHDLLAGRAASEVEASHAARLVDQFPLYAYDKKPIANPSGYVVDTLQAVFQAFFSTDSFEACLIDIVNRGGDADTTGAIAGMLAGACYGIDAIPKRWLQKLNESVREQCLTQASALLALTKSN